MSILTLSDQVIDLRGFEFLDEGAAVEVTVFRLLTMPACAVNERSGIDFLTPLSLAGLGSLRESELSVG